MVGAAPCVQCAAQMKVLISTWSRPAVVGRGGALSSTLREKEPELQIEQLYILSRFNEVGDINIAVNGCSGFATSTQKWPFMAMLISRSRGTCLIDQFYSLGWLSVFSRSPPAAV